MVSKEFLDIIPNRAGADMGSEAVFIHVAGQKVTSFPTHTRGLKECLAYLQKHNIDSVAVEATGVYWMNFFDICHESGLDVWLINPKYTKTRAGKKTDVQDAVWIQRLHSADFLEKSFVPEMAIRELREYVKTRENYVREGARKVNQMNKALIMMNIRLDNVISEIHGVSGMKMIEAILSGQRDANRLIELCHIKIRKHKKEALRDALNGNYQPQYLFNLRMALDDYNYLKEKIKSCDLYIQKQLKNLASKLPKPALLKKAKPMRHNNPKIKDMQLYMQTLCGGIDVTTIPGLTNYSVLRLISILGNKMDQWPTKKHFTSYLNLSPKQNQSGKSKKRQKKTPIHPAGQIFREIAQPLLNSKHIHLGVVGRKIRARKGPQIAIKALARKIAELFYICLSKQEEYIERSVQYHEETKRLAIIKRLTRQASKLGFKLIDTNTAQVIN